MIRIFTSMRSFNLKTTNYSSGVTKELHRNMETSVNVKRDHPPGIPRYGRRYVVAMLQGVGLGPELMSYVRKVFKSANAPVDFQIIDVNPKNDFQEELKHAILSVKRNRIGIKGNIEHICPYNGVTSGNVALRRALNLYVNVTCCKSYPGVPVKQQNVDIVIIRQNTQGEYCMREHENVPGVVESLKIITKPNSERVHKYAFDFARRHNRRKVTTVHKANMMKLSDGLFLEVSRKVAKEYPDIKYEEMIIDKCCMQLVQKPQMFDVMVMPNLYGAVVTNIVCGLIGGGGLVSGKNLGNGYAVFEPATRNAGISIAGQNVANPVAMLHASVDMLKYLGQNNHAELIKRAIRRTISHDKIHTPDLGGTASSTEVVEAIIENIYAFGVEAW